MKNILIIHTGGTISMLENKDTGEVNTTKEHPLSNFSRQLQINANIDEHIEFDLPSPHITPAHMFQLAKKVTEEIASYDGIIITHGTDTLEETAYFLDLVVDTDKPIILTGAMRSSNEIGSDALYNLLSSIRVACADEATNKGVLVVMNDEIHAAENVTKTSTSNVATFQSPQFGPIGIVTKHSILFHRTTLLRTKYLVSKVDSNVILLKAYAGMDEHFMKAIHQAKPNGIVIEALGQGNLPPRIVPSLKEIIQENIPIILVSRNFMGHVQPTYAYEGGGNQLEKMGVIFASGLSGPKARIKLLIALEETKNISSLKKIFGN
ncbi:asparaginase [Oceanobacillus bengalensis]|uniref:asparaginase n=1 Tax=Oceanobacillus bengalensis TaxID=1435466 RepID=A0A494Z1F8_9BACI|nr:asparaginase [Oceanobacillus bengalensis]RKQ16125.1 asparaginase [Oceanobacillus bengalensis]